MGTKLANPPMSMTQTMKAKQDPPSFEIPLNVATITYIIDLPYSHCECDCLLHKQEDSRSTFQLNLFLESSWHTVSRISINICSTELNVPFPSSCSRADSQRRDHSIFLDGPLPNTQAEQQWKGYASELLADFRASSRSPGAEISRRIWGAQTFTLKTSVPPMGLYFALVERKQISKSRNLTLAQYFQINKQDLRGVFSHISGPWGLHL